MGTGEERQKIERGKYRQYHNVKYEFMLKQPWQHYVPADAIGQDKCITGRIKVNFPVAHNYAQDHWEDKDRE